MRTPFLLAASLVSSLLGTACAVSADDTVADGADIGKGDAFGDTSSLGAHMTSDGQKLSVRLVSARASRVDLYLYSAALGEDERLAVPMIKGANDTWSVTLDAKK